MTEKSNRMRKYTHIIGLGLMHGVSDGMAGWAVAMSMDMRAVLDTGLLVLLYNGLAFGMQFPVGIWLDMRKMYRQYLWLSSVLSLLGVWIVLWSPWWGMGLLGAGSCIFHLAAGALSLDAGDGSKAVSIFAAPGVLGLMAGGLAGWQGMDVRLWMSLAMLILLVLVSRHKASQAQMVSSPSHREAMSLEAHDWVMMALLAAIAFRSAVWNLFQQLHQGEVEMLAGMAVAAALGKLAGGWLGDRLGWQRYATVALAGSALLLSVWGHLKIGLWLGTGLLQSATGMVAAALHRSFGGRRPATAAGLTFGTGIALGGALSMTIRLGEYAPWGVGVFLILALVGYILGLRHLRRFRQIP